MLALDDPSWTLWEHAYGIARDIPDKLRALRETPRPKTDYRSEPWFSLWSCLCHQGDVYTASYAAVPHIVAIANEATMPIDFSFFLMPSSIEISRQRGRGPALPDALAGAYHDALGGLCSCVGRHLAAPWDRSSFLSATTALAVAKGHIEIAEALAELDDDWIARINADDR